MPKWTVIYKIEYTEKLKLIKYNGLSATIGDDKFLNHRLIDSEIGLLIVRTLGSTESR